MFAITMSLRLDKNSEFHHNTLVLTRKLVSVKELKAAIEYHFKAFFKDQYKSNHVKSVLNRLKSVIKKEFKQEVTYCLDPTLVFTFQHIDEVKPFILNNLDKINEMKE
jgi:hypothetical protein